MDGRRNIDRGPGGLHPAIPPDEKRIAKDRSEPLQGVAHCRLGDAQAASRARHAALREERVECQQQIEIEMSWMHDRP